MAARERDDKQRAFVAVAAAPAAKASPELDSERRARRLLIALACGYALALAVLYALGVFTFVWKTAVVPALFVVAYAARRFSAFVRDWAVFLSAVALFDSLRGLSYGLICRFSLRVYMGYALAFEQTLFGSPPPSARLQAALFDPAQPGRLEQLLVTLHASHFLVFLFFGLLVWLLRPASFARFRLALLAAMYAALVCYIVWPTVPPWMAAGRYYLTEPIAHVPARLYNLTIPTLAQSFDVDPVAAMPSLHAAFPSLVTLFGFECFGAYALGLLAYTCAVCFAIVALGEHYVVDVLAGIALAALCYAAARMARPRALPSEIAGWAALRRPLAYAAGLLVLAQAAGLSARALVSEDQSPSPAFVRAELEGKSPTAAYYAGQLAFLAEDYARAERLFARATHELPSRNEQVRAYAWLGTSAYRAGHFALAVQTFASQPELTEEQSLMLAEARLASGERALGFQLLDALKSEHSDDVALAARIRALERRYPR